MVCKSEEGKVEDIEEETERQKSKPWAYPFNWYTIATYLKYLKTKKNMDQHPKVMSLNQLLLD